MCLGNRKNKKKIFIFLNKISIQAGSCSEKDAANAHETIPDKNVREGWQLYVCLQTDKV